MREFKYLGSNVTEAICHICQRSWVGSDVEMQSFFVNHQDMLSRWFEWRLQRLSGEDLELADKIRQLLDLIRNHGLEDLDRYQQIRNNPSLFF